MAKTISQRISLEGSEQIRKSLEELGNAGAKAFKDIQAAAEKTNFDQQKINSAKQAVDALVQSGTQLASKFQEIAQASAQFGAEGKRATETVTTGLNQTNAAADQTSQKIAAVGSTAQQSATTLTSAFRSVAIGLGVVSAAVTGLAVAYTAMGKSASESVLAIGRAASAAGTSIENFSRARTVLQQLGLSSSEAEQVIKRLGTTGKEAFEAVKARLKELGVVLAPISDKNIPAFMERMQRMGEIMVNGKSQFDDNTRALLQMGSAFLAVDGRALRTTERLTQLADKLAAIRDPAKQAALVNTIFGESLGKVLLPALQRGTGEFVNTIGLIDRLRLGTTEADRVIGQDFMRSWNLLQAVLKKNNEELGLLVAKPITPFLQRFAEAMRNNESVIAFLQAALEKITPALNDLLLLLEGRRGEVKLQWVLDAEKTIRSFGSAIATVFNDVVGPAFESLKTAASEVASALNQAFGTDFFSGPIVALGAAIGGLVGWFNALGIAALAAFADTSKGLNPVQKGLQAIGVDVEWLKEKLTLFWQDVVKLFSGRETEIDNRWLVDLKNAVVEFATSLPGVIVEVTAFLGLLARVVGPGRLASIMVLQFTGILQGFAAAAVVAGSGMFALFNLVRLLLLFMSPMTFAIGAIALAFALLAGNTDLARLALALFGVDLDKTNQAIDEYNAKSFAEASARSEQHYADVAADFERIKQAILNGINIVTQAISTWVTTPIANAWQWIVDTFNSAINWVLRKIEEAKQKLKELLTGSAERGGTGTEGSVGQFAHGGMVGGRGSGTSDSNLAWVSRGEHIMPARAVRQPGVLAFLEALRRSGGNLERVLDRMNHFALGGLVMPTIPAFAGGGSSGAMNHVTIQFPGLPAIGGLRASSEVVDELRKAAALAQIRSGGRKPSRYS